MSNQSLEHSSSTDPDARYFPRWEVDDHVFYQLEGDTETREGKTRDISCAGACIVGDQHIAPHQKIQLTIQLSETTQVKLKARILWVKTTIDNDHREMGVTFYNTTDKVRDSILQYAFEIDKTKIIKQWFKGWDNS